MIAALVVAFLLQGVPIRTQDGGTVTGTIRTADGKPAVGIRVAARPPTNNLLADSGGTVLASLAQTDEAGRYRLESILPGRYTISAGSAFTKKERTGFFRLEAGPRPYGSGREVIQRRQS